MGSLILLKQRFLLKEPWKGSFSEETIEQVGKQCPAVYASSRCSKHKGDSLHASRPSGVSPLLPKEL